MTARHEAVMLGLLTTLRQGPWMEVPQSGTTRLEEATVRQSSREARSGVPELLTASHSQGEA
jgi:hypothetical protein